MMKYYLFYQEDTLEGGFATMDAQHAHNYAIVARVRGTTTKEVTEGEFKLILTQYVSAQGFEFLIGSEEAPNGH